MKFEYWKSDNNTHWYWTQKAANAEKIAQSEGYSGKQKCVAGIQLVRGAANAPEENVNPAAH